MSLLCSKPSSDSVLFRVKVKVCNGPWGPTCLHPLHCFTFLPLFTLPQPDWPLCFYSQTGGTLMPLGLSQAVSSASNFLQPESIVCLLHDGLLLLSVFAQFSFLKDATLTTLFNSAPSPVFLSPPDFPDFVLLGFSFSTVLISFNILEQLFIYYVYFSLATFLW